MDEHEILGPISSLRIAVNSMPENHGRFPVCATLFMIWKVMETLDWYLVVGQKFRGIVTDDLFFLTNFGHFFSEICLLFQAHIFNRGALLCLDLRMDHKLHLDGGGRKKKEKAVEERKPKIMGPSQIYISR